MYKLTSIKISNLLDIWKPTNFKWQRQNTAKIWVACKMQHYIKIPHLNYIWTTDTYIAHIVAQLIVRQEHHKWSITNLQIWQHNVKPTAPHAQTRKHCCFLAHPWPNSVVQTGSLQQLKNWKLHQSLKNTMKCSTYTDINKSNNGELRMLQITTETSVR